MFTGIVQGTAEVKERTVEGSGLRLRLTFPSGSLKGLQVGASVSIRGTCLTVTEHQGDEACFDVIAETMRCTNLSSLTVGQQVNFERSASVGDEVGGHFLSGHITACVEVTHWREQPGQIDLELRPPPEHLKHLLPKGFVALDGVSLTVGRVDEARGVFSVHLIPETLRVTTLCEAKPGDHLNLEVDAMTQAVVATVERVMAHRFDDPS